MMQNSGSPHLDLSGKLIIKVALGDDIRRIPIHNEDITYDELVLMMQRVYRGKLSTNDDITIKYKDEDGDLITIFDSSDLSFAIQCSRILKITLFVNNGPGKSMLESADAAGVRQELQDIRDRVVSLLDRLSTSTGLVAGTQALSLAEGIAGKGDVVSSSAPAVSAVRPVNAQGGKEFDPLTSQKSVEESAQNKVMNSFGIESNSGSAAPPAPHQYDRAATPDSVSSIGSSASNQVRQQAQQLPASPAVSSTQQQQQQPPFSQQAPNPQQPGQPLPQQQQPPQQPPQQMPYAGQPGYAPGPPGQMGQPYAGQPGYGSPGQQQPQQQQQQQPQGPSQQPHQQQQAFDPAMYGQYGQGYAATGQPAPPATSQAPNMYGQPGAPYGQAPGMPAPQAKGPGYPPAPGMGQSPGNPYSRGGPTYGAGYPRPSAGYPQ